MQQHQKHRHLVYISMLTSHHLVLVFPVHCSSRSDRTLRNYFLLLFLLVFLFLLFLFTVHCSLLTAFPAHCSLV
jgi:hypothetical protein